MMVIGKLIGQGRTAEVYEYDNDKILKLFREDFPKDAIEYEYNVSTLLASNNINVPKVYELVEYKDRLGILYEKISGITLMRKISNEPWKISKFAETLAQIHFDFQKNIGCDLKSFKDRLVYNIYQTELDDKIKEQLKEYIDKLPDGDVICHGDFHPDNVIMSNDKSFVIDWMTASKGSPLSDIARTMVLFKFGVLPEQKSFIEKQIISFLRRKMQSTYIKHYLRISGACLEDIEKWELPIAAARLIEWVPKKEKDNLIQYIKVKMQKI